MSQDNPDPQSGLTIRAAAQNNDLIEAFFDTFLR